MKAALFVTAKQSEKLWQVIQKAVAEYPAFKRFHGDVIVNITLDLKQRYSKDVVDATVNNILDDIQMVLDDDTIVTPMISKRHGKTNENTAYVMVWEVKR